MEQGVLLRRYKRFLADIEFRDGRIETVHCANTGAMTQCSTPGSSVWCSVSESKSRKYARSLEVVLEGGDRVVVNTARANELIGEALGMKLLVPFQECVEVIPEVKAPDGHSRFDFLLRGPELTRCYVEVKSVTWQVSKGKGLFPDAKSARAGKHVEDLVKIRQSGDRAALVFCVQHSGIESVSAAADMDPQFSELLNMAVGEGVEVYGYKARIELDSLTILSPTPISLK
jgi:sugar fermentation stimulation protein A